MKKNVLILIVMLFINISSVFCQNTEINVKLYFRPGPPINLKENIDIKISILVDENVVSDADISSFPASIIQPIPNPDNKEIFFKVDINKPNDWVVLSDKIKYNVLNPKIIFRRINDAYITLMQRARSIKDFENIYSNKIFSSEDQKLEILRRKSSLHIINKSYEKALDNYVKILNEVDLEKVKKERNILYLKEFFDCLLLNGNYNNLNYPIKDFPLLISENRIGSGFNWKDFVELFKSVYPDVQLNIPGQNENNNVVNEAISLDFKKISKKLGIRF